MSVEDSKPSIQMFDGTFGGGNHSIPILEQNRSLRILGTDLDKSTLTQCELEYQKYIKRKSLALVPTNFVNIGGLDLKKAFNRKITTKAKFDIGLLDLGFSSYELEDADRGFSYLNKVPT